MRDILISLVISSMVGVAVGAADVTAGATTFASVFTAVFAVLDRRRDKAERRLAGTTDHAGMVDETAARRRFKRGWAGDPAARIDEIRQRVALPRIDRKRVMRALV